MKQEELQEIIQGCKCNEAKSQKQLYSYCYHQLMKVCIRYHRSSDEAAGSFNGAMLKVFQGLGSYQDEGIFLGWVRRIMVNTCITSLRSNARYEHKQEDSLIDVAVIPNAYQDMSVKEVLELVQRLPENMRLVFNLYVVEGFNHSQIAKILNISQGTSKWYLHEARKTLRKGIKFLQQ